MTTLAAHKEEEASLEAYTAHRRSGFAAYVNNAGRAMLDQVLFETKYADIAQYLGMQLAAYRAGWQIVIYEYDESYPSGNALRWRFDFKEGALPGVVTTSFNPMTGEEYE